MRFTAALLVCAGLLKAEIGGPCAGYIFDHRKGALRPLNGLPGALLMGDPVDAGVSVKTAAVHDSQWALLTATDGRVLVLRGLARPVLTVVENAIPQPDRIILSEDGTRAVLVSVTGKAIQVVEGLPDVPSVKGPVSTEGLGDLLAVAVGPRRGTVLVGVAGAVYARESESWLQVAVAEEPSSIVLSGDETSAVIADRKRNEVFLLTELGTHPHTVRMAGARDGLNGPAGLCAYGDNLLVANAETRDAVLIRRATFEITGRLELPVSPTTCRSLKGDLLLVNEPGPEPLILIDVSSAPTTYFVPVSN